MQKPYLPEVEGQLTTTTNTNNFTSTPTTTTTTMPYYDDGDSYYAKLRYTSVAYNNNYNN